MKKSVEDHFPIRFLRTLRLLVLALVVSLMTAGQLLATESEENPPKTLPPPTIEWAGAPIEVKMSMIGEQSSRRPFVELLLNEAESEKFLLDTGTSGIHLTQETAKKLRLKPIGTAQVGGIGDLGVHQEDVVLLESLDLSGMKIKDVPAVVMLNVPMRYGALGLPVLGEVAVVELDFKQKRLRLLPHSTEHQESQKAEATKVSLPFRNLKGKIVIEILINDRPHNAMVDTGAAMTLLSRSALKEIDGLTVIPRGAYFRGHARIGGVSGLTGDFHVVKGVRIGFAGREFSRPVVHDGEEILAIEDLSWFARGSGVEICALILTSLTSSCGSTIGITS